MSDKDGKNRNNVQQRISNQGILVVVALLMVTVTAALYLFGGQSQGLNQSESIRFQMGADSLCQEQCKPYTIDDSIADMKHIFQARGTDKGRTHGYYRTYGRLFHPYKNDPITLLEIGVQSGKSMGAWEDYFLNRQHVYGIGYGKGFQWGRKNEVEGTRSTWYEGDQSDIEFLKYVCEDAGAPYDILLMMDPMYPSINKYHLRTCWTVLSLVVYTQSRTCLQVTTTSPVPTCTATSQTKRV